MSVQKADQQIIYVGQEENLTDIRGRLEYISAHQVVLVVPSRNQLRGYVSWKLLSVYTQELGKEVTIVSSDPGVCALARSAQFQVTMPSGRATSKKRPHSA